MWGNLRKWNHPYSERDHPFAGRARKYTNFCNTKGGSNPFHAGIFASLKQETSFICGFLYTNRHGYIRLYRIYIDILISFSMLRSYCPASMWHQAKKMLDDWGGKKLCVFLNEGCGYACKASSLPRCFKRCPKRLRGHMPYVWLQPTPKCWMWMHCSVAGGR